MRFTEQSAEDRAVLAQVDLLSEEELDSFGRLCPIDLAHYIRAQQPWIEDEIYFLGLSLNHQPSDAAIANYVLDQPHSKRFRAFYALRYPQRVRELGCL